MLEQLASASVGGYGQDVWCELVEEARNNLTKITVSVTPLFLQLMLPRPSKCALVTQINNLCCPGWAVCGGILSQGTLANLWDSREDAKPRCHSILVFTNPRGLGQTGNILQPARHWKFQVNSKLSGGLVCCKSALLVFFKCLKGAYWIISMSFFNPQRHCLDRVFEQRWQFRRHSESPERRRHEGCTTSLAQIWGKETASIWGKTEVTFQYFYNKYCLL